MTTLKSERSLTFLNYGETRGVFSIAKYTVFEKSENLQFLVVVFEVVFFRVSSCVCAIMA